MTQGWACSACAASFYRDGDGFCQRCQGYVWVLYIGAFLMALAVAPLLINVSKSKGFMSMNIFVGTIQAWPSPCPGSQSSPGITTPCLPLVFLASGLLTRLPPAVCRS